MSRFSRDGTGRISNGVEYNSMKKDRTRSSRDNRPSATIAEMPFRELVETDTELKQLRAEYATQSAKKRRLAAQWAYDSAQALMIMATALDDPDWSGPTWRDPVAPLAIDPEYAPALLTVASLEHQYGRVDEAMSLFLKLTTLRTELDVLPDVIEQAAQFLINANDIANAEQLYAAAVSAFPQVALYHSGVGYCIGKSGRNEEAVAHMRRAVDLEPENSYLLNDLGFGLLEAGQYEEAEKTLRRSVELAPAGYALPARNLEYLMRLRAAATP
jgi:tetratricopeptide (TPR) repeat protein